MALPTGTTNLYPFTDNVGSVRALVKADGTMTHAYSYSAYGTTLTTTEASGLSQPYRYGGGYTDNATGLIKLGIRYYDPTQARFTQQDPTGQDPHYTYAGGSPETFSDPSGAISTSALAEVVSDSFSVVGILIPQAKVATTVLSVGLDVASILMDDEGNKGYRLAFNVTLDLATGMTGGALGKLIGTHGRLVDFAEFVANKAISAAGS